MVTPFLMIFFLIGNVFNNVFNLFKEKCFSERRRSNWVFVVVNCQIEITSSASYSCLSLVVTVKTNQNP